MILLAYSDDNPELVPELLKDADLQQYELLLPKALATPGLPERR